MSKKLKKISLKIEYINLELEEVGELSDKYNDKFNQEFREEIAFLNSCKIAEKNKLINSSDKSPGPSSIVQKIYRNLAKIMHPDVSQLEESEEVFKRVISFYESDDLVGLISISNEHNIPPPDFTEDEMFVIEKYIEKKEKSINEVKTTIPWVWCNSSEDREELKKKVYKMIKFDEEAFRQWKKSNPNL